jgi:hypothetical protein
MAVICHVMNEDYERKTHPSEHTYISTRIFDASCATTVENGLIGMVNWMIIVLKMCKAHSVASI